ncbi:hypothetical protein ACFLUR_01825 [Chloroflexota bacterium]
MPGKSRSRKGKYSIQGKKYKDRTVRPTLSAQQPAMAQTHEPVSSPEVPVAPANVPTRLAKPTAISYPYIAAELRTIGILAGIILIVLVVLAFVLS